MRLGNIKTGRSVSRLFFDEKGVAAIEFGVVGTVLTLLFLGGVDFGMGYWEQIEVGNAARAGAEYAAFANNGFNASKIETAVTSATSLSSIAATPAPTEFCGCPNATSGISNLSSGACGTPAPSCAGGGTAGTYVTVNAQASYTPIFPFSGFANAVTLSASMTARID